MTVRLLEALMRFTRIATGAWVGVCGVVWGWDGVACATAGLAAFELAAFLRKEEP